MGFFKPGILNGWLMSLPFFILGAFFMGTKKNIAQRMSDMTGYNAKEKLLTVIASIAPYPFMIATVWTPLTTRLPLLCLGLALYFSGMTLFSLTLKVIINTPPEQPFSSGPYRLSRNPLYMAATTVFAGICMATANLYLAVFLAVAVILQHFMILAEERICRDKYGDSFEDYMKGTPRYLSICRRKLYIRVLNTQQRKD